MANEELDVEKILAERERLERLLEEKFRRIITVMFTDLKGSTKLAETEGDFAVRMLIKKHNDIIFPLIKKNNGLLVKTMGDGTMSYFDNPPDAVRAGIEIQKGLDEYNKTKPKTPLLVRVGMHTGQGIVEESDIFGDVVNVASRFETTAEVTEVCFSEDTFNAVKDVEEFFCRFLKTSVLKGKKEPFKVFKAFWKPEEIEAEKHRDSDDFIDLSAHKGTITIGATAESEEFETTVSELIKEFTHHAPCLVIEKGGKSKDMFKLGTEEVSIGRSNQCSLVLPMDFISRKHARILYESGRYVIEDLQSTMGVVIRGQRITRHILTTGDEMFLGDIRITFVGKTSHVIQPSEPQAAVAVSGLLAKAQELESRNELIELFILCIQNEGNPELNEIYTRLSQKLKPGVVIMTMFGGREAKWCVKNTVITGRIPEADLPMSNQAISRVPVEISVRGGEGYIKIITPENSVIKPIELITSKTSKAMLPATEYPLNKEGVIMFSTCFPLQYRVYKDRLMIMEIMNPEEYIKKNFNFELSAIWKEFPIESRYIFVFGTP